MRRHPSPSRRSVALLLLLGAFAPLALAAGSAQEVDTVLLFGFGPFAGRSENASWLSVKQFSGAGRVHSAEVPVVWGAPAEALNAALKGAKRVLIVALGEGSDRFQVETVAHNDRGRYQDEASNLPQEAKVEPASPDILLLAGPADKLAHRLAGQGIPAQVSRDAGRFLCNEMLYDLIRLKESNPQIVGVFFVHVPVLNAPFDLNGVKVPADREFCARFGRALVESLNELYPLAAGDLTARL
jgi:pyroglutamyl-peptidase